MIQNPEIVSAIKIEELLLSAIGINDEPLLLRACTMLQEAGRSAKDPAPAIRALDIACIIANELNLDSAPLFAILLKPLADRDILTSETIRREFGAEVEELISGLTRIDRLDTKQYRSNAENFIKLLLTISADIRVVLVNLARRLYDMRTLIDYPPEKQGLIVGETTLLYIPIAHRIGLYRIKTELEDRVMRFTEPETYVALHQKLSESQAGRDQYTADFIRPIATRLSENGFGCEIRSRVKSIPSIRRKMQMQKVGFDRIYDLFAIRIIIGRPVENDQADCWKVYSLVTDIYTPNPRRLRDWITFPKSTGYESLHATVIGPEGKWVEVQIRSQRMDEIAEKGPAAHWKYKTGEKREAKPDLYASIREMLEKPVASSPAKPVSKEKSALYSDEIFIFTPKGDLKRLKSGYSVLDFAFEIHTDVGSTCTGAIVNGKIVPLKYTLQNGDTVKILTSKIQKPNHDWLEIVKSPRTQARIKHALKMENYKESDAGKELIKNKVIQLGYEFNDAAVNKLLSYFECENFLELYQRFGEGKLDPLKIKKAFAEPEPAAAPSVPAREEDLPGHISEVIRGKQDYLIIDKKLDSIHYQFARCCNPIPGDKIFAFVGVTQGIRIHKTNCSNAHQLITRYPYRILEARWKEIESAGSFTANLSLTGTFGGEIVDRLTNYLASDLKVVLRSIKLQNFSGEGAGVELGIQVTGKAHLDDVMKRLLKVKGIHSVKRLSGF